jgi:hypothetical protein
MGGMAYDLADRFGMEAVVALIALITRKSPYMLPITQSSAEAAAGTQRARPTLSTRLSALARRAVRRRQVFRKPVPRTR